MSEKFPIDGREDGATGGLCGGCGRRVHPYEAGLSVRKDGAWLCSDCTRSLEKRRGKDTRSIRRQHRWAPGHDPADPDAEKNSGWVYIKTVPDSPPAEPDQRDLLSGGPESGIPCWRCGTMTRICGESDVKSILGSTFKISEESVRKLEGETDTIVVVVCPTCFQKTQWRRSHLDRIRWQKLGRV